jgi:agmatinase
MDAPEHGFLGLPEECRGPEASRVHVLPVPWEATVSYGQGTRDGPQAIIAASQQVELYDPNLDAEPALSYGAYTLPSLLPTYESHGAMIDRIAEATADIARHGKLPLLLGGEHTISLGGVRGVLRVLGGPVDVVQIDAHADLRESYQGTPYSHACVMRRIFEEDAGRLIQVGIRSFSMEEAHFARANHGRIHMWTAADIRSRGTDSWLPEIAEMLAGRRVWLTIDVDGLDPSVIPSTGTPEPGGLSFREAVALAETVARAGKVIGMDCVELAPRPGLHMSEFAAARLLHAALNAVFAGKP